MKYNFVCLLLAPALLILATDRAWGDLLWRYGYSHKNFDPTKDTISISKIDMEQKASARGLFSWSKFFTASGVGIGLEYSSTSGRIRYRTLNGEKQENTLICKPFCYCSPPIVEIGNGRLGVESTT